MIRVFFRPRFFCLALCLLGSIALADDESKRPLEHADYDRWNTISRPGISNDGQWIMYSIQSGKIDGDQTLAIRKNGDAKQYLILRGQAARFSFDSKFAAFEIAPDPQVVKKLKKEKAKPEDMPSKRMQLLELATGTQFTVDRIKSFSFPEENGNWLAYQLEQPIKKETVKEQKSEAVETYEVTPEGLRRPEKPLKLKKRKSEESAAEEEKKTEPETEAKQEEKETPETEPKKGDDEDSEKKKKKPEQYSSCAIFGPARSVGFPHVTQYLFSKHGNSLAFATSLEQSQDDKKANGKKPDENAKDNTDKKSESEAGPTDGVYVLDLDKQTIAEIASGLGNYKNFAFNDKGTELAFVTDKEDYQSKTSSWSLYHWKRGSKSAKLIAAEKTEGIPTDWWVSSDSGSFFSEDGRRLLFRNRPRSRDRGKRTQRSQRKKEMANRPRKMTTKTTNQNSTSGIGKIHCCNLNNCCKPIRNANEITSPSTICEPEKSSSSPTRIFHPSQLTAAPTADIAVGVTNMPYRKMLSWDVPGFPGQLPGKS